jgi:hypothetical protein
VPPSALRLLPVTTLAPFLQRVGCASTFSTAFMSIDAVLHQGAVGADAGLAGIPIFRGDRRHRSAVSRFGSDNFSESLMVGNLLATKSRHAVARDTVAPMMNSFSNRDTLVA